MTSDPINYTLVVYQESNSHTTRGGYRESHPGSHAIVYSTDEQEIIDAWSNYLFKNQSLAEIELEHEVTLLQNGLEESFAPYNSDEYAQFRDNCYRIRDLSSVAITKHLAEKQQRDALAKQRAIEQQAAWVAQAAINQEAAERAQYVALRAKFGG